MDRSLSGRLPGRTAARPARRAPERASGPRPGTGGAEPGGSTPVTMSDDQPETPYLELLARGAHDSTPSKRTTAGVAAQDGGRSKVRR